MPVSGGTASPLSFVSIAPSNRVGEISSSWVDWDLSAVVPVGARFVEVQIKCNGSVNMGVRKNGTATSRLISFANGDMTVMTVELDGSRIIEEYSGDAAVTYSVTGYWI